PDNEVSGIVVKGLAMRLAFDHRRNDIGLMVPGPERWRRAFGALGEIAPAAFVAQDSVELLPALGFFLRIEQRKLGTCNYRDVGAAGDLEQPQRALRLFFHPLVARNGGEAQDVE